MSEGISAIPTSTDGMRINRWKLIRSFVYNTEEGLEKEWIGATASF